MTAEKINPTEDQIKMSKEFAEECVDMAHEFACKLIDKGMKPDGAGSMAAHAMIHAAWQSARVGVIAEGREPNPEHFIEAVTSRVKPVLHWRLADKPRNA